MKGVNVIYTIQTLLKRGWSLAAIAREISADRETVRKIKKRIVTCRNKFYTLAEYRL